MKKNKHQGEGLIPAISRRHFIQVGSALAALPFVVKTGKVQAQDAAVSDATPEEKVVQTCSTFTAAASVIFVLTSVMAL